MGTALRSFANDKHRIAMPLEHHRDVMPDDDPCPSAHGPSPVTAYVGIGANLGDRRRAIEGAIESLAAREGIDVLRSSSLYRTASIGAEGPDYLNAVVELRVALDPLYLLQVLQSIEAAHGRERSYPNAPRTLDLDLLLYGAQQLSLPTLQIPHPRLHERAFVLRPLAELSPGLVVPGLGRVIDLAAAVTDQRVDRV
jgi:2-amino-4-hydroxy-6-hydroxymethyldihydropteridine diphosphokinase